MDDQPSQKRQKLGQAHKETLSNPYAKLYSREPLQAEAESPSPCIVQSKDESSTLDGVQYVFVWDLDETLILFHSLINGKFAEAHRREQLKSTAAALGNRWQDLILAFSDQHFFYSQVEDVDITSVLEPSLGLPASTSGQAPHRAKLSDLEKLSTIIRLYEMGLQQLLDEEVKKEHEHLFKETDELTNRWLSHASDLLMTLLGMGKSAEKNVVHVLVSTGHLVATFGKLLLFRLSNFFEAANVYSAMTAPKAECFRHIERRFSGSTFVVIGDGAEEKLAADSQGWPFLQICLATKNQQSGRPLLALTADHVWQTAAL